MSVASINSGSAVNNNQYMVNSISKNPAGIAISANMESQKNGYDVGEDNAKAGQNLLDVSDGALSSITDSLQRIRELSLQASNSAIYSDDDMQAMQDEVSQLKQQIQGAAKDTEFNTIKIADGSKADIDLATNPKGTGMQIKLVNSTLESLGIDDYDLTSDFDISKIDDALSKVTASRSDNAAASNSLSYQADYNEIASYNLESSQSKYEDIDIEDTISKQQKDKVMQQYQYFTQNQRTDNQLSFEKMLM
jgi:flagellin